MPTCHMTFTLGTLTFGGTTLFETTDEIVVLLVSGDATIRIPKNHA